MDMLIISVQTSFNCKDWYAVKKNGIPIVFHTMKAANKYIDELKYSYNSQIDTRVIINANI